MASLHNVRSQTLSMLEERIARIDYAINGDQAESTPAVGKTTTSTASSASARVHALERTLHLLAAKSHVVSDILQLQKRFPELFHPADERTLPSTLHPASLAQLVLAHEKLYKTIASQLTTLHENSMIPDTAPLVNLIALQPRIDTLAAKQIEQAREFADLRLRSAKMLERYYQQGVLDMEEKWVDWEERLRECEILVRRKEAVKKREEGML